MKKILFLILSFNALFLPISLWAKTGDLDSTFTYSPDSDVVNGVSWVKSGLSGSGVYEFTSLSNGGVVGVGRDLVKGGGITVGVAPSGGPTPFYGDPCYAIGCDGNSGPLAYVSGIKYVDLSNIFGVKIDKEARFTRLEDVEEIGSSKSVVSVGTISYFNDNNDTELRMLVIKQDELGEIDTTFGLDGNKIGGTIIDFGSLGAITSLGSTIKVLPDGKILAAGYAVFQSSGNLPRGLQSLVRLTADGNYDTTFGPNGNGMVATQFESVDGFSTPKSIVIQEDGKILLSGWLDFLDGSSGIFITRYDSNGTLDSTFGENGSIVHFDLMTGGGLGYSFRFRTFIQSNKKFIQFGASSSAIKLVRFNIDGSIDSTYGDNGSVSMSGSTIVDAVMQSDDKIIVLGYKDINGVLNIELTRFLKNGTPDANFGVNGVITSTFGIPGIFDVISMRLDSENKIIIMARGYRSADMSNLRYFFVRLLNSISPISPTDITLSNNTVSENSASDVTIGTLSAVDVNAQDTHTFSFCGGSDDNNFTLSGATLQANAVFDYESKSTYSVCLRATDSENLTFDKTLSIFVSTIPIITSTAITNVDEDSLYSYTLGASDVDNDELTWSVTNGTSLPSWLTLNPPGPQFNETTLSGTPSNADVGTHPISLTLSDGVNTVEHNFTINVYGVTTYSDANVDVTIDNTVDGKTEFQLIDANSVTTSALSDFVGAITKLTKDLNGVVVVETSLEVDANSSISLRAKEDGSIENLVRFNGLISSIISDIAGAFSHITTDASVETRVGNTPSDEAGYTIKANVITDQYGETQTSFVKVNDNDPSDETVVSSTLKPTTAFAAGNSVAIKEMDGTLYMLIRTSLGDDNLEIE